MASVKAILSWVWVRWQKVAHGITRLINFVLLGLLYILAIGPTSIVMRLMRNDILDTHWDPGDSRSSFWQIRPTSPVDIERHKQQF